MLSSLGFDVVGMGFLSTPYHGYLKNLALAVSGKMDSHFGALWYGGHVKFFSIKTLQKLLIDRLLLRNFW
jgi:2-polyprenyl-6-hydroxyphenyl methylase/3-demethylubiquinone-9 3-methyltransferase